MNNRVLYKFFIALLIITTLTCNLVMITFLQRFFYGNLEIEKPASLHRLVSTLGTHGHLAYPDYKAVLESTNEFDLIGAGYLQQDQPVFLGEHVLLSNVCWITGNFNRLINTPSIKAGRFFSELEDNPGEARVVVINESTWERISDNQEFHPGVQVFLKGQSFEIIGIVVNKFPYLDSMKEVGIWAPVHHNPEAWQYTTEDYQEYQVLARVSPDRVHIAEQQLDSALSDIKERLGFFYAADIMSETDFRIHKNRSMYNLFSALLSVTGVLFILGTVNQFLMLVTRSVTISNDLKVMVALGASAKHVLFRFIRGLTSLFVLSLSGVAILSAITLQLYNKLWGVEFGEVPLSKLIEPMPVLLIFAMALGLVALHVVFPIGMYFLQGDNLFFRNRSGGSGFSIKNALSQLGVIIQIALASLAILTSAAFLASMGKEKSIQSGIYEDRIVSLELSYASKETEYSINHRTRSDAIYSKLLEIGGVESLGASRALPLHQGGWTRALIEGAEIEDEPGRAGFNIIGPGYFETVGIKLLEGVNFEPDDGIVYPYEKYIINEAYAKAYFEEGKALGRKIAPWDSVKYAPIIGIVENEIVDFQGTTKPLIYIPEHNNWYNLHIRLADASLKEGIIDTLVQTIRSTDPGVIVISIHTIGSVWKDALLGPKLGFYVLGFLSLAGLALAMTGIFGYQSYTLALREREFAIQHALGLSIAGLYLKELKRGLWLVGLGLILGTATFVTGAQLFASRFYNIGLRIPSLIGVAIFLLVLFGAIIALASLSASKPKLQMLLRE